MKNYLVSVLAVVFIVSFGKAQSPVFYGMTQNGGANGAGTLFRYNVSTGTDTVLHSFGAAADGALPSGSLFLASNGLLYGLTAAGGAHNLGTLFTYNIGTGAYADIHDFGDTTDAQTPHGTMIEASNGMLYGMSESGGVNSSGTIFSYNRYTESVEVVYNFGAIHDGELPFGSLINIQDSLLYGLTLRGGAAGGFGALFNYNIIESTDTVLYNFGSDDTDSQNPYGSLVKGANGWLYGMTRFGGNNNTGTIFGYYYSDTTEADTLIYSFGTGTDAQYPYGSLLPINNTLLYGMTQNGGANDSGTIFFFNLTSHTETVAHSFSGGSDGSLPRGSLISASNNLLYGMTQSGGANGKGTIFSYSVSGANENTVYSFGSGTDGATPLGDLIEVDGIPAITGIEPVTANEDKLTIFPNPSSGQFTVTLPNNQNAYTAQVYDVLGNKIYQAVLSNTQNTINLNNQAVGMYFIYVQTGDGVMMGKVMVAK